MDGASKFVRGDAIAGLIITAINFIGGFVIGLSRNMSLTQSFRTFSILSVGDKLVSQMPALIIATASGMLVIKATTQTSLGVEISSQVAMNPRPLFVGALILTVLALAPGLPLLPFAALAGLLYYGARRLVGPASCQQNQGADEARAPSGAGKPTTEMHLHDFLQTDRATVEVGARLIPLVDPHSGNGLLDSVSGLRRDLARKDGLWVPSILLRDNIQLEANTYPLLIGGLQVARGQLRPERLLAIDPGKTHLTLEGEATKDPAFGLPARWISENDRQRAELGGYTVVDAPSVLITYLREIIRRHVHELFSREDLKMFTARGQDIAFLTDGSLRRPLRLSRMRSMPDLAVIAFQEVPGDLLLEPVAMIKLEDLGGGR
jgi:flagellar biosynthesis protein FlhA